MLHFSVDGAAIGDTITLPRGGGTVEVEATADSIFPIHKLDLFGYSDPVDPFFHDHEEEQCVFVSRLVTPKSARRNGKTPACRVNCCLLNSDCAE